jgi:hypothetical protein
MTTSDRVLAVLASWLEQEDLLPDATTPRLRDYDGVKTSVEVILDADDPDEHDVLRGVDTIEGEIILDVSADDSSHDGRQAMLSELADGYDVDAFLAFANDAGADRGLVMGEGLKVFDFRMAVGGSWEPDGRRFMGKLSWMIIACPV